MPGQAKAERAFRSLPSVLNQHDVGTSGSLTNEGVNAHKHGRKTCEAFPILEKLIRQRSMLTRRIQ